jgi:hypothetical protein
MYVGVRIAAVHLCYQVIHCHSRQRTSQIIRHDCALCQNADMDVALNELDDGQFCIGEYYYSLMVFGDDVADTGPRAARAIGAVGEASSLQMAPVDLVADAAWFAQWPGNWQWRPRDAKLSSRAFAALAAGHNFTRGKRDGNPWGEALALMRTPSGQPFYLNLHVSPEDEDSADKKLPGNTLIIGSTGVGKTTLEMFLLALTRKWNPAPRLVLFDLDRGCEIAMRALGGRYFTLEAGKPTGCNPLQRDPTPARLQFWEQLVRTCIETPALPLMPADERAIAEAVRAVAMMPAALRRFSTLWQHLHPQHCVRRRVHRARTDLLLYRHRSFIDEGLGTSGGRSVLRIGAGGTDNLRSAAQPPHEGGYPSPRSRGRSGTHSREVDRFDPQVSGCRAPARRQPTRSVESHRGGLSRRWDAHDHRSVAAFILSPCIP